LVEDIQVIHSAGIVIRGVPAKPETMIRHGFRKQ
jgi:hypothetical protein